jgi:hypothetical protein
MFHRRARREMPVIRKKEGKNTLPPLMERSRPLKLLVWWLQIRSNISLQHR